MKMSAANINTKMTSPTTASSNNARNNDPSSIIRSGSGSDMLLSKSMGMSASFLRLAQRNMSESESDPTNTIRHAGYLLKRSNLPYCMPSNAVDATGTSMPTSIITSSAKLNESIAAAVAGGIAPLPDLSDDVYNDNVGLYSLPFGGLDEIGVVGECGYGISDVLTLNASSTAMDGSNVGALVSPSVPCAASQGDALRHMDPTPTTFITTDDAADENITSTASDEPCFCSPIIQYFEKLFHVQQPIKNALVITGNDTNNNDGTRGKRSSNSNTKQRRHGSVSPKIRLSPKTTTRPLPIAPNESSSAMPSSAINRYIMPLKEPARSDPVPISPSASKRIIRGGSGSGSGGQLLSRSVANGRNVDNMIEASVATATTTGLATALPRKEYPPPPPDYIDPKDGHIWRAKYCILECGILYFYRTAEEGESDEAHTERYESRMYSEELEDIVLGEELVITTSSPRAAAFAGQRQRSMMAMEDRKDSSLHDLSKSPMPLKKSDIFFDLANSPFHRSGSSVLTGASGRIGSMGGEISVGGGGRPTPLLHHSSSTNTFHHDADILWEKRVALDCVGAVRSSDQEHGYHAFELLAYGGSESDDASSARASTGVGGQQHEIIDRLILRAGSSDDMNTWMFQFHRSLASFMQQIVNSVRTDGARGDRLGRMRSPSDYSPTRGSGVGQHHGRPSSPFLTKQSFASSPTTGGSFVGSLSHGHGRNALYRRQVRDNNKGIGGGTGIDSTGSVVSPLPTPLGTPFGTPGSSPVDAALFKKKPLMPSSMMMIQSDSSKLQKKVDLPNLKDLRGEKEGSAAVDPVQPKKYIPPHMRATKKYMPPHMRRKLAAATDASGDNGSSSAVTKKSTEEHLPLNDEIQKNSTDKKDKAPTSDLSDVLEHETTLSDSLALSATSTSSMLSRQLEEEDNGEEDGIISSTSINVRLGGCADPTVIGGSITDHHFIGRKASVVGNVRLEAYSGTGGGFFASPPGGIKHRRRRSEEEESMLLDDLDMDTMMGGSKSGSSNANSRMVLKWEVGAASECGIRNSNEDSYVVINNLDELIESQGLASFSQQDLGQTKQQGLYAIFDGHVGNQAARFSAEKFPVYLMEEQSSLASRDSACLRSIEERADSVLREAFGRLDREFCSLCTRDGRDWDCGSTALVALIVDDVVSLANLGDCRGVVCRLVSDNISNTETEGWEALDPADGKDVLWDRANGGGNAYASGGKLLWKEITETHSPLHDEELARIEKANGWIIKETEIPISQLHRMDIFDEDVVEIVKRCFADRMKHHRSDPVRQIQIARTCGDLAVSRAIGDRDFKAAYNMPSNNIATTDLARSWEGPPVFLYPEGHSRRFKGDLVSDVPDIKVFKVGQEGVLDEFLLMACDGLWDVMDSDDAVRIAKNLLFEKKRSAKDGASRLAELAQHLGSSDNITVILIRFYWEECKEET